MTTKSSTIHLQSAIAIPDQKLTPTRRERAIEPSWSCLLAALPLSGLGSRATTKERECEYTKLTRDLTEKGSS